MTERSNSRQQLTPREWEVLALLREGLTNEQIALRLAISRDGVKYHVSEVLGKLGVDDRIQAARWYDRETRRRSGFASLFGVILRRDETPIATNALVLAVFAVFVLAVVALITGLLVMETRKGDRLEALPEDRQTGDPRLDEMLAVLLNGDAAAIEAEAGAAIARQYDSATEVETLYETAEWAESLGSVPGREVYAVLVGDPQAGPPRDFDLYLRVPRDSGAVEGWGVAVADYRIVDVSIGDDPSWLADRASHQLERFVVLPPADELPPPPPGHELSARTGDAGVDAILERLEAHDSRGVLSLVEYIDTPCGPDEAPFCDGAPEGTPVPSLPVRECFGALQSASLDDIGKWLGEVADTVSRLHSIIVLPQGNLPAGDHMLLLSVQEDRFRWNTAGLIERNGSVVGLVRRCGEQPEQAYPPLSFIVPPPDDLDALTPDRRSGVVAIDDALNALADGDVDSLAGLIDYATVECVTEVLGIGSPPQCLPGEAPGTEIEVLGMASCEGYFVRRTEIRESLTNFIEGEWALYAVADLGGAGGVDALGPGRREAILIDAGSTEPPGMMALFFSDDGLSYILHGCGRADPYSMLVSGRAPDFLLAPLP